MLGRQAVLMRVIVPAMLLASGAARADATPPASSPPASSPPASSSPAPDTLTSAAAWNRVVGNTLAGTTPDGTYSAFFAPDGSVRQVDQDGKATGTWSLKGDTVCIAMIDEDEDDCRAVTVTGRTGAFTDSAGSRYPFEILPGNAKNL